MKLQQQEELSFIPMLIKKIYTLYDLDRFLLSFSINNFS